MQYLSIHSRASGHQAAHPFIPAKAGIQPSFWELPPDLGPRLRGDKREMLFDRVPTQAFIRSFPARAGTSPSSVHSRESGNPDFPLGLGPRLREDERVMLSDQVAAQAAHPFIPAKAGIRIFR
jgi:hypothetical protein